PVPYPASLRLRSLAVAYAAPREAPLGAEGRSNFRLIPDRPDVRCLCTLSRLDLKSGPHGSRQFRWKDVTDMPTRVLQSSLAKIVSRPGAWIVLAIAVLASTLAMGMIGSTNAPGGVGALPDSAESAQVEKLQKQFPDGDIAPVIAVFSRDGHTLSDEDMTSIASIGTRLGEHTGHDASQPIKSRDGDAAIVSIPMSQDQSDDAIAESIDQLRTIAHGDTPEGVDVQITGGPAFGADIAGAFDGANFTLLAVTIGIVAVLLLLTYRSPILWLVPMAVIGLADGLAGSVTGQLGQT